MDESTKAEALAAVHDVATRLLKHDMPKEVNEGLRLIISITSYKHDVRTCNETGRDGGTVEHTESHERDGVNYEIIVERKEVSLWGRWDCPLCNEGGHSGKACTSIESAVEAAIFSISLHHYVKHCEQADA
jgi:hypothetical protein